MEKVEISILEKMHQSEVLWKKIWALGIHMELWPTKEEK